MIYIDSSCLTKVVLFEIESQAVARAVLQQTEVVVSPLAELETQVQLKAGYMAGTITWNSFENWKPDYICCAIRNRINSNRSQELCLKLHSACAAIHVNFTVELWIGSTWPQWKDSASPAS